MADNNCVEKLLDNKKLKKTKARILILELLKGTSPKTVDEIYGVLSAENDRFSLSTIYRTCETLSEKAILLKSNLTDDGKARYELPKSEHIHHAICLGCNKIISIDDCPFGQFDQLMKAKYGFSVTNHRIEIFGYCSECQKKHSKK